MQVSLRNWYLEDWFGETKMQRYGFGLSLLCMILAFAMMGGGVFHV